LVSPWLLVSLGLLLAIRLGTFDLSTWSVMWLAAVTAGTMVSAGYGTVSAILVSILVGAAGGLLAGLAGMWHRQLGVLASVAVAVGALWCSEKLTAGGIIEAELIQEDVRSWLYSSAGQGGQEDRSARTLVGLPSLRLFAVGLTYALVLVALIGWNALCRIRSRRGEGLSVWSDPAEMLSRRHGRLSRLAGHVLCGILSALAGLAWLLEHGRVEAPRQIIGDLRVLVAPILAGAFLLRGQGRTLATAALLPVGLMVATRWRQQIWPLYGGGLELQLLVLLGMVLIVQAGLILLSLPGRKYRWLPATSLALGVGALAVMLSSASLEGHQLRRMLHWAGVGLSLAALIVQSIWLMLGRRSGGAFVSRTSR
jgi:ribose/xylose/arabinose/galactoside ABC-type transport system permease subunit